MGIASVGECLLTGTGVEKNQTEGLIMLVSAAKDGSDWACYMVGKIYYLGEYGSKVNFAMAKFWLEKAVAEGEGSCEYNHLTETQVEQMQTWISECNAFLDAWMLFSKGRSDGVQNTGEWKCVEENGQCDHNE